MKVTNIENTEVENLIYIDDEYKYTLNEEVIKEYQLYVGRKVGYMEDMYIQKKSLDYEAINKSIKKLSYRLRTKKEMSIYLKEAGYSKQLVDRVVAKLTEMGYIDDLKYCEVYISYYINNKLKSKAVALSELKNKGVSSDIIRKVLNSVDIDDTKSLLAILKKKVKNSEQLKDKNYRDKIKAYLYRKGFNLNQINKTINQLIDDY
ncbi:regulatory protein RecX [Clostridiaceae bacterium M8S5]|nr:regulatory protein RecX [Clostridiaceae bacterium M8S5]